MSNTNTALTTPNAASIPSPAEAAAKGARDLIERRLADLSRDLKRSGGRRATISDTRETCEAVAAIMRAKGWPTHLGRRAGKKTADYRLTVGQAHQPCVGAECAECEGTGIVPR